MCAGTYAIEPEKTSLASSSSPPLPGASDLLLAFPSGPRTHQCCCLGNSSFDPWGPLLLSKTPEPSQCLLLLGGPWDGV